MRLITGARKRMSVQGVDRAAICRGMRARKGEAMSYQSIFRPDLFRDQVMVVTGGGSGIGRCIAHELAALGAIVVITGRTEAKLKIVAAEIKKTAGVPVMLSLISATRRRSANRSGYPGPVLSD